jgi:alanyl-tRNA synthetase
MSTTNTTAASSHPVPTGHLSADAIRRMFIEFFKHKPHGPGAGTVNAGRVMAASGDGGGLETIAGHAFVPSSPCVPIDDPTLLFTNAGMNQFKPIFLGQADPSTLMGQWRRAVNSQKCIRAGGKHNDLEDVGKDTYHHTFFEMLGNWSFGDYFKVEAIGWSFELLTKVYGINPNRLYATYFEGNPKQGLPADEETKALWLKYLPADHILPGNMKDNFWEMGESGPCGPCTEIHYDRIGGRNAAAMVNQSDPDVIEIWNNVFIQFNRETDGSLRPLPAKHVDTGMGLERLVSVLQDKRSNYDTDVFMPIFAAIERLSGAPRGYMGRLGTDDKDNVDTAYRVIADHIRTLTFAITDGALPSNVGRGYVLRRILRRAARYGRQMLNARTGLLSQLVPTVVERFGEAFPELRKNPEKIRAIILEEEESFGRTLDRGIKLFEEVAGNAKARTIAGSDAFKLYDTYGFPIDLTVLMAEERGLKVDLAGYEAERAKAEEMSRSGGASKTEGRHIALSGEQVAKLKTLGIEPTDDSHKFEHKPMRGHVRAIWNGENFDEHAMPTIAASTRTIGVITDRTGFYATMGGQSGDAGKIEVIAEARSSSRDSHHGGEFIVESTEAFGGYVLHIGHMKKGEIRVGDTVMLSVDMLRRMKTASNHTATHLTNWGLREVLGDHVDQKGSLVAADRMRFDFTHNQPVSAEELTKIELHVSNAIQKNLAVHAQPAPINLARNIAGLRAVFGEAYPDPVRVVSIGKPVAALLDNASDVSNRQYSVEFCGGTHVESTAIIGDFAIVGEEAVAKGVRRVTGLTGEAAGGAIGLAGALESRIRHAATSSDADLAKTVTTLSQEVDAAIIPLSRKATLRQHLAGLQERVKNASKAAAAGTRDEAIKHARAIADSALNANDLVIVSAIEIGDDRQALQAAVKTVRDKCPRSAVMLLGTGGGAIAIHASVPDGLIAKGLKAGDWVREVATAVGGKGGGKPDNAQGGGTDVTKVQEALTIARTYALRLAM